MPKKTCLGPSRYRKLFSPLCGSTIQRIATQYGHHLRYMCCFFWVVNASRNEKSCLQFFIPTAVFHMLLSEPLTTKMQKKMAKMAKR